MPASSSHTKLLKDNVGQSFVTVAGVQRVKLY